ncbi:MAG: hypothetical protein SXQ77_05210 [Halobacteria archaeon]|nr:hypothetical protein [Halobacteria archaeon]
MVRMNLKISRPRPALRRFVQLFGVLLVVLAAGFVVVNPDFGIDFPEEFQTVILILIGVTALVVEAAILIYLRVNREGEDENTEFEVRKGVGDDFDAVVNNLDHDDPEVGEIRSELRGIAVETVARRRGCTPDRAEELVNSGTWTDDSRAASFLGDGASVLSPGFWTNLSDWLNGEFAERRIDHSLEALQKISSTNDGDEMEEEGDYREY